MHNYAVQHFRYLYCFHTMYSKMLPWKWNPKGQLLWTCICLFSEVETYLPECSLELYNHSSGVTCEWFSWPEDQSGAAYLCEHLLFRTKASAVRPTLRVADLQHPGRLRRETYPASTNTLLDNFKHDAPLWTSLPHMKDEDSSFIWARCFVWWNALTWAQCSFGSQHSGCLSGLQCMYSHSTEIYPKMTILSLSLVSFMRKLSLGDSTMCSSRCGNEQRSQLSDISDAAAHTRQLLFSELGKQNISEMRGRWFFTLSRGEQCKGVWSLKMGGLKMTCYYLSLECTFPSS